MAEKGIVVADATSGESVACRDALLTDNDSNSRIIQLVDLASRYAGWDTSSTLRSGISSSDSNYWSSVPTAILNNALDISDAEGFIMIVKVHGSSTYSGNFYVTPWLLEAASVGNDFVAYLKRWESETISEVPFRAGSTDYTYVFEPVFYPTYGAARVGFHVNLSGVSGLAAGGVDIFAAAASSSGINYTGQRFEKTGGE